MSIEEASFVDFRLTCTFPNLDRGMQRRMRWLVIWDVVGLDLLEEVQ